MLTNKQIDEINQKHFNNTFVEISNDYRLVKIGEEHLPSINYNSYLIIDRDKILITYECSNTTIYRASTENGVLQYPSMLRLWIRFMESVEAELQSL